MSPEYPALIANLVIGSVGGGFKLTELGKLMMKGKKASKPILQQTKKTKPLSKEAKDRINAMREEYKAQEYMDDALGRSSWDEYKQGGQIPEEQMLRLMFALGGEIPEGRRMYGMSKKKKPVMQTSTAGMPVRGMKKGGKVKYHV